MSEHLYRDAETGQIVSAEYAEANPATTVKETIELSYQDQQDLAKLDAGGDVPIPEDVEFHPILQVWREILKPARTEATKKITPQWASRIVASYQDVSFAEMKEFQTRYYSKIIELLELLEAEIDSDSDCLTYGSPEEDAAENHGHYISLLRDWQVKFLTWELEWDCEDPHAGVELAAISETHKAFFGQTGVTQFLENIRLEMTEDDQNEVATALEELRGEHE